MKPVIFLLACLISLPAGASPLEEALSTVRVASGVEPSSAATQQAWRRLSTAPPSALPDVLMAMKDCSPSAQNWLRAAADAIVERAGETGEALPLEGLRALLENTEQAPRARRTAYEFLLTADPSAADEYLPHMLNDPSIELRYDAVARVLNSAEESGKTDREKTELLEQAIDSALNLSQLETCKERLEQLGQQVDLTARMGFLTKWMLIGPFDNTAEEGFAVPYPPESNVDFNQTYPGKAAPVAWQSATSDGELGLLDLTKTLGPEKGAVAYAYTTFVASRDRRAELRYTSHNASKVWVNGEWVCENEVYHAGDPLDQYRCGVQLNQGENSVLVKVCQNEQSESWAQNWDLRLRFTDQLGKGLTQARFPANAVDTPGIDSKPLPKPLR